MDVFADKYGRKVTLVPGEAMDTYIVSGLGSEFTLQQPAPSDRKRVLVSIEAMVPESFAKQDEPPPPPAQADEKLRTVVESLVTAGLLSESGAAKILAP